MAEPTERRASRTARADVRKHRRGRVLVPLWAGVPVAVLAGIALWLAYPATGWWPLLFVGIALSLLSLIGRSAGGAFLVGLATGAALYFPLVEWAARYLGPLPWIALAALESLLWAGGSILVVWAWRFSIRVFRRAPTPALVTLTASAVAAAWMLRELVLGSFPYSGFPWARVGMALSESPLARLASWTSVTGLGFIVVFAVAALVGWLLLRRGRPVSASVPALIAIIVLATLPAFPTTPAGTYRVGAVQGDGPTGYFDERAQNDVLRAQVNASAPLAGQGVQLVLWPEGGIDSDPTHRTATAATLDALSRALDAPLLVNAATARGDRYFNTSMLWQDGADNPLQIHDKREPVPFGEYVPDRSFFRAFAPDLIDLIQREYTHGTNAPLMNVDGVRVGLAICFDVIYDDVIWEGARGGAEFYAFQTNNADFRGTAENQQQLAFARMRAIETGRTVINLSTVGESQVIAPDGATLQSIPIDEPGAMIVDVELRTGLTPAVLVGPGVNAVLLWGSALALLVLAGFARRAARRDDEAPDASPTTNGAPTA
ncbi:apolipoprotein N-acyltransferase [uncultured Microbacterium sp.]|uniref:apolipoprotein N-acyltransferase n=1 Tax=uncultured Microbacterium sp. TaxID=191216 RepID=UPI0025DBD3C9|nr:apolipoprotein N-acyltransferase [uncultured Microbacterium sp.]